MGNVLKYEIKRSRFMMLIVGIIIGGLELAYLIGFFGVKTAQNEKIQDIFSSIWIFSIVLLVIAACCSMLVGVLYSVLLYNSDIRKKSGYMLFLTPTPTWQWILAKILMGVLATAVLVIAFAILGIALEIFQSAISSLFALLSNGLFSISINMSEDGLVYDLDTAIPYLLAAMALNLIFAGVCYGVTTYLTDKKMSV